MPSLSTHTGGPPWEMQAPQKNARPKKTLFLYLLLAVACTWIPYTLYTRSDFFRFGSSSSSSNTEFAIDDATGRPIIPHEYGSNAQPAFTDMIRLMNLPTDYLPQTGKHRKLNRLIIVGDVHGMKDALVNLLAKVHFDPKHDHLILAGDMVSKGPDSPGVVDLAMKLGASGVRGNHEDRVILVHADMVAPHGESEVGAPGPHEDVERVVDDLEEASFSRGDYQDRALVRALGEDRIKWLKKCPVILRVGQLEGMGQVVVVHAGLAPGVALEHQDLSMVMNMRTIAHGVPSEDRKGQYWNKIWNKHQKKLPKKERTTVIYGHDSKRGLQLEKYSMGLDTGCVKGGKLSAVVIEGGLSSSKHRVVHVKC
ncbi:hypothetical protein DSL72_009398 [Monilinia vaccinii-corymbosi]|uniref:Calcineurin-like phosphoesterase domain-containing protein n=1 Tax=Monilinia vaccinii-corymbosi TaxID=61207 RepID=A0A8A3PQZ7_9HELO|nr:hypothetical protein DSL72_009398 [Monilinia vaccinii-corymbosi]